MAQVMTLRPNLAREHDRELRGKRVKVHFNDENGRGHIDGFKEAPFRFHGEVIGIANLTCAEEQRTLVLRQYDSITPPDDELSLRSIPLTQIVTVEVEK